jgi:cobalt-zinc-cadmium efflux system protein
MHLEGVCDVHHIHIWSMDGGSGYATMHIVTDADHQKVKREVREELLEHGIAHATLELEDVNEPCCEQQCHVPERTEHAHTHHHHHH